MAAADIGAAAAEIFVRGDALIGDSIGVAGDHLSGAELAVEMSAALGKPVSYNAVTPDAYRHFGFPGAEELGNMWQFKRDFETAYLGRRDLSRVRALNPATQTFKTWTVCETIVGIVGMVGMVGIGGMGGAAGTGGTGGA